MFKLLPVLSDYFFSETVSPLSSTSSETSSRDSLTLDTQTEDPRVAVQIKKKSIRFYT